MSKNQGKVREFIKKIVNWGKRQEIWEVLVVKCNCVDLLWFIIFNLISNFSPQKAYMAPSLELSTVVWLWYIALKLLWRIWEFVLKEAPPVSHLPQIFYKNLLLSYDLSHFVPIFNKIEKETCPGIRSIISM